MKTGIVSALNHIANGFAASYATALQTMRGFSAAQESGPAKPMVNTAISPAVAKASENARSVARELDASKLDLTA
jgi:hypothetical protein